MITKTRVETCACETGDGWRGGCSAVTVCRKNAAVEAEAEEWQREVDALRAERDDLLAHEQQTHESLGAILGADDSLEQCAQRMKAERDEAMALLEEVSPMTPCARCGESFRLHTMVIEEGDEWECAPCNKRENQREHDELSARVRK